MMACQEVILQFFILLFYLICGVDGDSIAECFYPALEIKKVVSIPCKKKPVCSSLCIKYLHECTSLDYLT